MMITCDTCLHKLKAMTEDPCTDCQDTVDDAAEKIGFRVVYHHHEYATALATDDLRHHTELGTGYSKDAQLCRAADEIDKLRLFAATLLDPEIFGHAVTAEVRDAARVVLGRPMTERSG